MTIKLSQPNEILGNEVNLFPYTVDCKKYEEDVIQRIEKQLTELNYTGQEVASISVIIDINDSHEEYADMILSDIKDYYEAAGWYQVDYNYMHIDGTRYACSLALMTAWFILLKINQTNH